MRGCAGFLFFAPSLRKTISQKEEAMEAGHENSTEDSGFFCYEAPSEFWVQQSEISLPYNPVVWNGANRIGVYAAQQFALLGAGP